MANSSERPTDTQDKGIKFLINIPFKVDSVDQTRERCANILENLQNEGFKSEENARQDVALIFGLNGKFTEELRVILDDLEKIELPSDIKHSKITFTWGEGGDIATAAQDTPYQEIREYLKKHSETKHLVHEMKNEDPGSLIYFSFVDSDTLRFNHIYSEYMDIVKKELDETKIPPTVMSTGYEFEPDSDFQEAGYIDRMIRVITAEHFPLGTYYPEPNFCVLVPHDEDHIPESFIDARRKNMESPVLISQVKRRDGFKAVFPDCKPIIVDVPERFRLSKDRRLTNQSHYGTRNWAISAYAHGELINKERCQGIVGRNRTFFIKLLKCEDDDEFEIISQENPFSGPGADAVIEAAKAVRKFVKEMKENVPTED